MTFKSNSHTPGYKEFYPHGTQERPYFFCWTGDWNKVRLIQDLSTANTLFASMFSLCHGFKIERSDGALGTLWKRSVECQWKLSLSLMWRREKTLDMQQLFQVSLKVWTIFCKIKKKEFWKLTSYIFEATQCNPINYQCQLWSKKFYFRFYFRMSTPPLSCRRLAKSKQMVFVKMKR